MKTFDQWYEEKFSQSLGYLPDSKHKEACRLGWDSAIAAAPTPPTVQNVNERAEFEKAIREYLKNPALPPMEWTTELDPWIGGLHLGMHWNLWQARASIHKGSGNG